MNSVADQLRKSLVKMREEENYIINIPIVNREENDNAGEKIQAGSSGDKDG